MRPKGREEETCPLSYSLSCLDTKLQMHLPLTRLCALETHPVVTAGPGGQLVQPRRDRCSKGPAEGSEGYTPGLTRFYQPVLLRDVRLTLTLGLSGLTCLLPDRERQQSPRVSGMSKDAPPMAERSREKGGVCERQSDLSLSPQVPARHALPVVPRNTHLWWAYLAHQG